MQLVKIKQETPALDLVIMGGGGAHLVSLLTIFQVDIC